MSSHAQIFDAPSSAEEPVEARWDRLSALFTTVSSEELDSLDMYGHYTMEQKRCQGSAHLDAMLQRILDNGGEGCVRVQGATD